jgi:hypothetical protein
MTHDEVIRAIAFYLHAIPSHTGKQRVVGQRLHRMARQPVTRRRPLPVATPV